jgi:hypothetical protein
MKRLALASTVAAIGLAAAGTAAAKDVRCDSSRNSYNYCSVDTRGGVRLVDQESRARCDYRDTWGYDANGIWVSNGCRAVFRVGSQNSHSSNDKAAGLALGILALGIIAGMADDNDRRPSRPHHPDYDEPRTVRCESGDKRYTYCRVRVPSYAELVRQRSSAACSYGRTWGYDSRGIWVDKGCRGDFAVR